MKYIYELIMTEKELNKYFDSLDNETKEMFYID